MSVGGGACVGDGAALVAAPNKPVAVLHAGGLTEQPMNAAALAPFARAAVLGRDVRAAREAEQDQTALHGGLWTELEAAEATVEAAPVPPRNAGGGVGGRAAQDDERSRFRRTLVAACRSRRNQCERHHGRLVHTLRHLEGELAAAEAAAWEAARNDDGAAIANFPPPPTRKSVSVDEKAVFIPSGGAQQLPGSAGAADGHEMEIAFGSFGEDGDDRPVPPSEPPSSSLRPVLPGEACGARAAAVSPFQGPEPVHADGHPARGTPETPIGFRPACMTSITAS